MPRALLLLLVEDESVVLLSTQLALEEGGYTVATAADGAEALAAVHDQALEVAGLITDVRLGSGPNVWDVARQARELNPELPVIYATEDSANEWPAQGVPKSILVRKPYAPAQVVTAISTLLTKAHSSAPTGSEAST